MELIIWQKVEHSELEFASEASERVFFIRTSHVLLTEMDQFFGIWNPFLVNSVKAFILNEKVKQRLVSNICESLYDSIILPFRFHEIWKFAAFLQLFQTCVHDSFLLYSVFALLLDVSETKALQKVSKNWPISVIKIGLLKKCRNLDFLSPTRAWTSTLSNIFRYKIAAHCAIATATQKVHMGGPWNLDPWELLTSRELSQKRSWIEEWFVRKTSWISQVRNFLTYLLHYFYTA